MSYKFLNKFLRNVNTEMLDALTRVNKHLKLKKLVQKHNEGWCVQIPCIISLESSQGII